MRRFVFALDLKDDPEIIAKYERDVEELRSIAERLGDVDLAELGSAPLKDPELLPRLRELLIEPIPQEGRIDEFFRDREKVVWDWPDLGERLMESWDDGYQR